MATSRSGREFARRMKIVADAVKRNTVLVVKRAAIAADQAAVLATPVDTGRLRANWLVSIGIPDSGEVTFSKGKEGSTKGAVANEALSRARDTIGTYKLGMGGIYISNNVSYAYLIDAGRSEQAPKGMTARAILAASRQLGSAKLLDGV